jgi:hypothetical protein
MSKFLKLLNSVLNEEDVNDFPEKTNDAEIPAKPVAMDDEASKLPDKEDVALDIIKYKNLLKALREALYNSASSDIEKQREISNINVDSDDLKELKNTENTLMSILNQSEAVPETQE